MESLKKLNIEEQLEKCLTKLVEELFKTLLEEFLMELLLELHVATKNSWKISIPGTSGNISEWSSRGNYRRICRKSGNNSWRSPEKKFLEKSWIVLLGRISRRNPRRRYRKNPVGSSRRGFPREVLGGVPEGVSEGIQGWFFLFFIDEIFNPGLLHLGPPIHFPAEGRI